jgi:hypothetical protein
MSIVGSSAGIGRSESFRICLGKYCAVVTGRTQSRSLYGLLPSEKSLTILCRFLLKSLLPSFHTTFLYNFETLMQPKTPRLFHSYPKVLKPQLIW